MLENVSYVPTLAVRASEMNGLEFLPGAAKDRMTPCFLLAPWANSNSIARTITRLERAYPNRPYFLDLDYNYAFTNYEAPAQIEMLELMKPADAFGNWTGFVREYDWIMPCVQVRGLDEEQIGVQIRVFQSQGKPYCLRIVRDREPDNLQEVVAAFSATGVADFSIILEGGWVRDPLTLSLWFSGMITGGLSGIDARVPIVLSCTSIPKMFTDFSANKPISVPFRNRELVDQVARGSNRARVLYGDWGSTRPRESSDYASRPLARIDFPTDRTWLIARNKKESWDFRDAANAIVRDDSWDGSMITWGEEMIKNTTINAELGIDTPQKNVASRVNIHLHRQAFFGEPPINPAALDEEWRD